MEIQYLTENNKKRTNHPSAHVTMPPMNQEKHILLRFYDVLFDVFGSQHWWPGESPFEVMVGTVLTQNTNWTNVEKAIRNLKKADLLDPEKIDALDPPQLAELIRPAGYFNIKAKRLKNLVRWFCREYQGVFPALSDQPLDFLREQLLSVNGIGRETADSIILYALEKPTFVVDTYTYRILVRHGCIDPDSDYELIKEYCQTHLPEDLQLYNEFHALIVRLGKNYCKPKPRCNGCPLEPFDHFIE